MRTVTHQRVEFEQLTDSAPDHLSIASFGDAASGKTTLIHSMPEPIGVIALDRKTRPRLQTANRRDKKNIVIKEFIRHSKPLEVSNMDENGAKNYYTTHFNRIQDAAFSLAESKDIRSIAIDSATQLWEDCLFRHFGRAFRIMPRDRSAPNADMRELINACQGKHLLLTHQSSEVWRNDKPTGRYSWSGWSKLGYYCNLVVEHDYSEKDKEFSLTIRMCQDRPDMIGQVLTGETITFEVLAALIYPDGQW